MLRDLLKDAYERHHFCNKEILRTFRGIGEGVPEKASTLIAHIANAQHVWNHRVLGKEAEHGIWELHALDELEDLEEKNRECSFWILENEELEKSIDYRNSKGKAYRNLLRDILFHVVDHGSYHRGQIAREMRENGFDPLVSDYVIFRREEL
jgi:uncharacterized damage-inducible protein DinB